MQQTVPFFPGLAWCAMEIKKVIQSMVGTLNQQSHQSALLAFCKVVGRLWNK